MSEISSTDSVSANARNVARKEETDRMEARGEEERIEEAAQESAEQARRAAESQEEQVQDETARSEDRRGSIINETI